MPSVRTELGDGTTIIRAYEAGIELAVFEAACESVQEIGPAMRAWREGATYEKATRHVSELELERARSCPDGGALAGPKPLRPDLFADSDSPRIRLRGHEAHADLGH